MLCHIWTISDLTKVQIISFFTESKQVDKDGSFQNLKEINLNTKKWARRWVVVCNKSFEGKNKL